MVERSCCVPFVRIGYCLRPLGCAGPGRLRFRCLRARTRTLQMVLLVDAACAYLRPESVERNGVPSFVVEVVERVEQSFRFTKDLTAHQEQLE